MQITIIIVNWNTKEYLKDCLHSIHKFTNPKLAEVIVVDNASSDGSYEMVRKYFPSVRLIDSKGNIGFARANNLAIPLANSEFVLFLNPDTLIVNDTIDKLISFMNDHNHVGAIGCKMRSNYDSANANAIIHDADAHMLGWQWFPSPLTELFSSLFVSERTIPNLKKILPYHDPKKSGYVSKLYGGCLMVRREVLEKVGYFDERFFMYCEDVDLSRRIIDGGWKLYYMSETEIIHFARGSSSKVADHFSTLMQCESMSKLMQKYYGVKGKILYILIILFGSSVRLIVLFLLICVSNFSSIERTTKLKESIYKYIALIKWSLKLKKPKITS